MEATDLTIEITSDKDWWSAFPKGPDLTPPDEATCKRFGLSNRTTNGVSDADSIPSVPFYVGTSNVWAMANNPSLTVYALFNNGTNSLKILARNDNDPWREVKVEEIDNLYGFIWKMTVDAESRIYNASQK